MLGVVMPNTDKLLTAAEVAALVPVATETVRRWTREGRLEAVTLPSGRKRYRESDVRELLGESSAA